MVGDLMEKQKSEEMMWGTLLLRSPLTVAMVCDETLNKLWHLERKETGAWRMVYIGYAEAEPPKEFDFLTFEDVPKWAKERRAILRMLDIDPHISVVYGVGRRIGEETYWVVEPREDQTRGNDA